jgi:hypothetical protein
MEGGQGEPTIPLAYKPLIGLSLLKYTMSDIFETNVDFPFEKITLNTPTSLAGGVYFSKIMINKRQLYIQSPKCKTKQGVVKTGKKIHSDLVFSNDDEEFIQWIEMLELTVRKHIFTNREKWFDTDLDEDDIESYFTPTVKIFKSGKQYLMRVNVSQRIGSTPLKIYDENEIDVEMESINETTPMITILEIQGVRCSAKSFQIDIELKQIMVLRPVNIFEKCIIKSKEKDLVKVDPILVELKKEDKLEPKEERLEPKEERLESKEDELESKEDELESKEDELEPKEDELEPKEDEHEDSDILEINLNIDEIENSDTIHLKEKTDVYYQMYREARQKAKLAKSLALSSYFEARRIKNLYMLEDIDDSDESDLEDLENE